jgi:hypothetical protein
MFAALAQGTSIYGVGFAPLSLHRKEKLKDILTRSRATMSNELRAPLLSSDRRPDLEHESFWHDLLEELKSIVALAGPACIQLGFQQVRVDSKCVNCVFRFPNKK